MGREYRISCPPENLPKLEAFLKSAGGLSCTQSPERLEFRFGASTSDEMPDATASIESAGLYFCDHCGSRELMAVLFRRILDEALNLSDSSDSIVVTSL